MNLIYGVQEKIKHQNKLKFSDIPKVNDSVLFVNTLQKARKTHQGFKALSI